MSLKQKRSLYLLAGLSALVLAPLGIALGRPTPCITLPKKCDYDLLCAFKIEVQEKLLLYKTYSAAKRAGPNLEEGDAAQEKYDALSAQASDRVVEAAKNADCSALGVTPKPELRGNWSGMNTNRSDCFSYVTFGRGESKETYTPDSAKEKATGCLELWDSDMGHERVHKQLCLERSLSKDNPPTTFGSLIQEDISAYRYSLQAAADALYIMQIRCTADKNADAFRKRADKLLDELKRYDIKVGPKK